MFDNLPEPPAPSPDWSYYLDFDGTLVGISSEPHAVSVDRTVTDTLANLQVRTDGAVAIVSGRPIAEIDRYLGPSVATVAAGLHGGERRYRDGRVERADSRRALTDAVRRLHAFGDTTPGILVEEKGLTLALHYRNAPDQETRSHDLMLDLLDELGDEYKLIAGKMVFELKPVDIDKGRAIEAFREDPPFEGRVVVMIGDDRTDEDGFAVANETDGLSIRVGGNDGRTVARYGLNDPRDVLNWLSKV